jgi:phage terminase large subunit-like protein
VGAGPRPPRSVAEQLAALPREERIKFLGRLDDDELLEFAFDWRMWARPEQLPPSEPFVHWGIVSGRGAGKTRGAAEFVKDEVQTNQHEFVNLVGRTAGDVRDVMIEGESGLLAVSHPDFYPKYEPSKKRITWPNGCIGSVFNSTEPDELRGPQCSLYWGDEIAAWKYPYETWDNLMFGFRLGNPRGVFTTTPKPIKLVRDLMSGQVPGVVLAPRMTTYDNLANLAATFIQTVVKKYEGTRKGRQELLGELLLDVPGALWTLKLIDDERKLKPPREGELSRIVVAIDPAVTSGEESNETGIIVAGRDRSRPDPHFCVLRDISGRWPAIQWARKAVKAFHDLKADRIVAEVNNGGDLVQAQIRIVDRDVPYSDVRASRGKYIRAEPIAALYEQGRVHHVGSFDALEDQMITFVPDDERDDDDSPDRVDALVWALTALAENMNPQTLPGSSSHRTYG